MLFQEASIQKLNAEARERERRDQQLHQEISDLDIRVREDVGAVAKKIEELSERLDDLQRTILLAIQTQTPIAPELIQMVDRIKIS